VNREHHKIAFINQNGAESTYPSLVGLIEAILNSGYGIDIYSIKDSRFLPLEFPGQEIRTFILPGKYQQGQIGWRFQFFLSWLPYVSRQCHKESYDCLIGIDPWGLLIAGILSKFHRIPYIYLSLEIMFYSEQTSPYLKVTKLLERWSNQHAGFSITQDWDRATLLEVENKIPKHKIEILPNAPSGPTNPQKTNDLREILQIPDGIPIVLFLGGIGPLGQSLELARHAKEWDFVATLVFHGRYILTGAYGEALYNLVDKKRIIFSDRPVPASKVSSLVSSADIGIALYNVSEDSGKNIFTMGLSSGKIAHYLQCGLPVVATGLPTIKRYIEGYNCGICVDAVDQVGKSVKIILDNYSEYSRNALICFQQEFELNKYLEIILHRVNSIIQPR
jgi:glycosyltransferase involved in cell wall biosynthesis